MEKVLYFLLVLIFFFAQSAHSKSVDSISDNVEKLLKQMTLQEKIGQLNQFSDGPATGPPTPGDDLPKQIKLGNVGSLLNVVSANRTRQFQDFALQSRLKIPLIFGLDVVHGYKATFPIPLGEAASWDLDAIKLSARVSAVEASAGGIHWTFAPMVDIARDPRWGRVMEGAGEDPFLGSLIAKARVEGFQGESLRNNESLMACAKHFAAYGAALGGRDYNDVDMSLKEFWETYLPPFKACVDAGVATFMNSFNSLNGVPATGDPYLQRDILKGKWNYSGFVVSDWGSIGEMINHGFAGNKKEASFAAIKAGSDMDMESRCYINSLKELVDEKSVDVGLIDDAVRRILTKKFELGLFEDPYKNCDTERERIVLNDPRHLEATRKVAQKSIVLLKNANNTLPISLEKTKTIAFIGPMVKEHRANMGFWSVELPGIDYTKWVPSQWEAMQQRVGNKAKLVYSKGCEILGENRTLFPEAISVAQQSDIVIMSIGEGWNMSGEAKSRSNIEIPGVQVELVQAIAKTGKPIVVLINAGRPLVFNWIADNVQSILYTWWLGTKAGAAISDVLFGDVNPSGKLPMTFPRAVGQIPIYHNHFNTGRPPRTIHDNAYVSAYIDIPNDPKFPFGFGLSYTTFKYSNLVLSSQRIRRDDKIIVKFEVTNTGRYPGAEVIQLYLRDFVGSVVRPIKELKGFQKVKFDVGEKKTIQFVIDQNLLSFYNTKLEFQPEKGSFGLMIGSSSEDIRLNSTFELIN